MKRYPSAPWRGSSAPATPPRVSLTGLFLAGLLCALTFTPSMIPRPWLFQAVLAGVMAFTGYGLGVAMAWLWRFLELPLLNRRLRHLAFWPVVLLTAGQLGYYFWYASDWQNATRVLMGLEPVESAYYLRTLLVGACVFLLLLALAWLLIVALRWVSGLAQSTAQRRFVSVVFVSGFLFLLISAVDGWLISRAITTIDLIQARLDKEDPEGSHPPTRPTRSGGPESLVSWDELGREGKRFVHEGPRRADIEAYSGQPAKEPIRVYAGLRAASNPTAQAQRVLAELKRTGAFSRKILVIATPTGTGWLENAGLAPLEFMHGGDTAVLGVQYSYLPSPLSLILEPGRSQASARAVFDVIHGHWRSLPKDARPALYLFGLSLGSLGSEASITFSALLRAPFQGAVWAGPPFRNTIWRRVVAQRNPQSPEWAPEFEDGSLIRVITPFDDPVEEPGDWGPVRIVYVSNPSDAIVFFRENMWRYRPDWFAAPRGPDITDLFEWFPIVTLFQVAVDMQFAAGTPEGHGHNYAMRDYARAWAMVSGIDDWSDAEAQRLTPYYRDTNL